MDREERLAVLGLAALFTAARLAAGQGLSESGTRHDAIANGFGDADAFMAEAKKQLGEDLLK